jgi:LemA protein
MSKALIIILILIAILVVYFITGYNRFIKARNNVEEAFSTMDVYLKKRFDLIPNLVETVKGYAAHEAGTLQKVTDARAAVMNSATTEDKLANESVLTGTLRSLFAVAENYPDLKANQNFLELQGQLQQTEDEIASSRKYYNAVVKIFNTMCETFPSNIIASIFHFVRRPMFEVSAEEERQNVNVSF